MAARVERLAWRDVSLDNVLLPLTLQGLSLGLGSGLTRRAGDRRGRVFAVTDRGPNIFASQAVDEFGLAAFSPFRGDRNVKIMIRPRLAPEIVELQVGEGDVRLVRRVALATRSGHALSGIAPAGHDERLFDVGGALLHPDPLGVDTEAIAVMPDGGFFLAEEYGPSLLKADARGAVSERWAPEKQGRRLQHAGLQVRDVLPAAAARRRPNRGFEALCASGDGQWLFVGFQSSLMGEAEDGAPIWKLDARTGKLAGEWLYPFDAPDSFGRDAARRKVGPDDLKICELAWAGGERLVVLERISQTTKLYAVDLARLPAKRLLMSSDDHPEIGPDMEGMTLLSSTEILLVSDNDFGVEGAKTQFWRVTLDAPV